jgi:DNA-binding IclR family transcriptional regulator
VFETIAERQPVGVSELAQLLGADKSAVQRATAALGVAGRPIAVVLVSAPTQRATALDYQKPGAMVAATARSLSHGPPPRLSLYD